MERFTVILALAVVVLPACDDVEQATSPERVVATPFSPPPAIPIPTRPTPPPSEPNDPPTVHFSIRPEAPGGTAPVEVTVILCGSTDPEGEPLVYQYKWGGGAEHFSSGCRQTHVYETPGSFRAFFCVYDQHDNRDCVGHQRIDVD